MIAVQGCLFAIARTIDPRRHFSGLTRHALPVAVVIGCVTMLSACLSVPSQEMSDARRALDAAVQADARRLLPIELGRANAKLDSANEALRSGHYDEARELARSARDAAIVARVLAARLVQVRAGIATARAQGHELQGAEALIQQALKISRDGDTDGALLIVEQVALSLRQ
ncbi:MAG: hypothetical protein ACI8W7_001609 [Gammaproteobacteria bacterium]